MKNDKITRKKRIKYSLIFLLIYFLWSLLFTLIGDWAFDKAHYTLSTKVDEIIPFVSDYEYIYIIGYIIPFVPLIIIKDVLRMNVLIISFILMNIIAFTLFITFPVYCPRPTFEINSLSTYLLSLEHIIDKPVNNFPSLHAGIAWLLFLSCRGYNKIISLTMFFIAIGIGISALFLKQHYFADIIAGIIISWLVYKGVNLFMKKRLNDLNLN